MASMPGLEPLHHTATSLHLLYFHRQRGCHPNGVTKWPRADLLGQAFADPSCHFSGTARQTEVGDLHAFMEHSVHLTNSSKTSLDIPCRSQHFILKGGKAPRLKTGKASARAVLLHDLWVLGLLCAILRRLSHRMGLGTQTCRCPPQLLDVLLRLLQKTGDAPGAVTFWDLQLEICRGNVVSGAICRLPSALLAHHDIRGTRPMLPQ